MFRSENTQFNVNLFFNFSFSQYRKVQIDRFPRFEECLILMSVIV